jgi:hypothetical protein
MTLSMYQASVPVFIRQLNALAVILGKAEAHATEHKIDPAAFLQARLYPDMFALPRQVQIATDAAKGAAGRLAGVDLPVFEDVETTFPELIARCNRTVAFLDGLTAAQIDGTEDKKIVLKMRDSSIDFVGQQYLLGFAMPNFYFHISMVYAILRHNGVQVGKRDFLGAF